MRFDISHAITELYSSAKYVLKGFDYSGLEWYDEKPKPSEEELLYDSKSLLLQFIEQLVSRMSSFAYLILTT